MYSHKTLVICGATASGKTSLALRLAQKLPKVNILSADSRQVFKDLSILTGKDIPPLLPKNINLFGLDLVDVGEVFNLSDYYHYAKKVINDSIQSHTPLIIVGGTGLYIQALIEGKPDLNVPPDINLRSKLEKLTLGELQEKLQNINPDRYVSLNHSDKNNPRRLVRHIEISLSKAIKTPLEPFGTKFILIGLSAEKESRKKAIRSRVLDRINQGVIDEVKSLISPKLKKNSQLLSSLGVKEILRFINSEIGKEELIEQWTAQEIEYARRQDVWFKKQKGIVWYDKSRVTEEVENSLVDKIK